MLRKGNLFEFSGVYSNPYEIANSIEGKETLDILLNDCENIDNYAIVLVRHGGNRHCFNVSDNFKSTIKMTENQNYPNSLAENPFLKQKTELISNCYNEETKDITNKRIIDTKMADAIAEIKMLKERLIERDNSVAELINNTELLFEEINLLKIELDKKTNEASYLDLFVDKIKNYKIEATIADIYNLNINNLVGERKELSENKLSISIEEFLKFNKLENNEL